MRETRQDKTRIAVDDDDEAEDKDRRLEIVPFRIGYGIINK